MIKYELQRPMQQNVPGFVMIGNDFKTVKSSELQKHLDDGWFIVRKRYFLITPFLDWWKKLKNGEKISFFGVLLIPFIIPMFFPNKTIINVYPSNESDSHKAVSDSELYDSADSATIKKLDYKPKSLTKELDSVQTTDSISILKN